MVENGKVIWKEGMFLQPQHFQQAERYIFDSLHSRLTSYIPYHYGLHAIEVSKDALANNQFTVSNCNGVLPDGTPFDIPKKEVIPRPRSFVDHLTPEMQALDVYLGLPLSIEGKSNVQQQGVPSDSARYKTHSVELTDDVFGSQRKEIEIGSGNFVILFGDESRDTFTTLPIARLTRNTQGLVVVQDAYIPPLLSTSCSHSLSKTVEGLLEILLAKITSLSQGRRQKEGGFAEFTAAEETAYRLLQVLNTYTPLLNYYRTATGIHPFTLYQYLMQFAGSLGTFSSQVNLSHFPAYDHLNCQQIFEKLAGIVRIVLQADISAGSLTLPIEQIKPSSYQCRVPDASLFSSADFYLAVNASVERTQLIVGVVQRVKMSAPEHQDALISSAMPGIQLIHAANPPDNLSTKPDYVYFSISKMGDLWQAAARSGTLAIYFPHSFENLSMEIIALKQ
ncbi:MAG: type VI secretion system baseplate subunit TssK [Chitinivibrionales bacterium]|nr:type VI secretion system baseplate subunit TssK [Chitinivibrionales bacterium]